MEDDSWQCHPVLLTPRSHHNWQLTVPCMCDFHLNQAQYRFCVCLQSIHDSSDLSQSSLFCFTITTTTGTLYVFRLVSDNKKRNIGHHHKQCYNFVMKPWDDTRHGWRLPWWKENKSSLKVSRWSMITFPPTSLRNHTTSSYELSNKVSRLKLSSVSSSMVSFSISWQEKSNTIITRETSTQRRPQVSWTQIHRSDAEMRIKVARLGPAVRGFAGSGSA